MYFGVYFGVQRGFVFCMGTYDHNSKLIQGTEKAHKLFQHKLLAPTQMPHLGTPEESLCASFPGKERNRGPT